MCHSYLQRMDYCAIIVHVWSAVRNIVTLHKLSSEDPIRTYDIGFSVEDVCQRMAAQHGAGSSSDLVRAENDVVAHALSILHNTCLLERSHHGYVISLHGCRFLEQAPVGMTANTALLIEVDAARQAQQGGVHHYLMGMIEGRCLQSKMI